MAYPVLGASLYQTFGSAGTWTVTETPSHLINDIIVAVTFVDGNSYVQSASAGWVSIGTRTGIPAETTFCQAWYRVATSDGTAEAPVLTLNANEDGTVFVFIIRDCDPADVVNVVSAQTDWSNVAAHDSATVDPDETGCLLIYIWCSNGSSPYLKIDVAEASTIARFTSSSVSGTVGYRQHEPDTVSTAVSIRSSSATDGGTSWVIAFNNATSGSFAPDIRPDLITINDYGSLGPAVTWYGPTQVGNEFFSGLTALNSISLANATVSEATFWEIFTASTATNQFEGAWHAFTGNFTNKAFTAEFQTSRAGISGGGRVGDEGILVGFTDGTNYEFHRMLSSIETWAALIFYRAYIVCGKTIPVYYSNTVGDMDWSAVTKICYMWHKQGNTADTMFIKDAFAITNYAITGGGTSYPSKFTDLPFILSNSGTGLSAQQGNSQTLVYNSIQIGDGVNSTYFDSAALPVTYPPTYANKSALLTQGKWNVPANSVSINVKAKSGDTINIGATSLYSVVKQAFTIDAASSSGATYITIGLALVGYDVTDYLGIGWNGAVFNSGGTVTIAGGGDLTNCTISKTTSTNAALAITANDSVLDGSTTSVDPYLGATKPTYHIELGTAVTTITLTDHTFSGSALTDKVHVLKTLTNVAAGSFVVGVHYRINTVGSTDFTLIGASANTIGVNFTATGVGSGTGTADQAVKITISGTTSLAEADCTTAGAPAWVAAPQPTLSATVLANTRCLLWNRTTSAELDNAFVAGTSYSKIITSGASSNDVLDLYTFKEGYEESVATIIYAGANASFAVSQATDDAIQYYRTEESITDYTTLTEFNFYSPDIYIQADDADGESTLKKLFIFYNGVLTTADGATYMRGGVTFNSAFDVVINRSVRAIAVDNVSVTYGLHFTDEDVIRITTDDGTSWIAPPSAPGSIRYAFGVAPGQIETGVSGLTGAESTQLMALPSAAATATAVWSKTLPL